VLDEDKVCMPWQNTWVRRRTVSLGDLDEEEVAIHPKTGVDGYRDTVFRYFMACLRIQNASDTTFAASTLWSGVAERSVNKRTFV
jgi:hypothetical protein